MWYFAPIPLLVLIQIYLAPYTKVEESFNIQAIHDILQFRLNISSYDHNEFPGVVPRTFIGPLVVAILSAPVHFFMRRCDQPLIYSLYLVRGVLSAVNIAALYLFIKQVKTNFGLQVAKATCFITVCQFHFLYYISRPLPNTFAMGPVLMALYFLMRNEISRFIWTSAFAILIFRSELAVFLGLFLLAEIFEGSKPIAKVFIQGFLALITWISLSTGIDSFFWQETIWPEGMVFYFNVVLNKSSAWGVSPFHYYFTKLLPKALGPLVPILMLLALKIDTRFRKLALPCVGFVFLYSFLPHKELRFVIYTVPVFNVIAARGWAFFSINASKRFTFRFVHFINGCILIACFAASTVMFMCSMENYPGGVALDKFHKYVSPSSEINLHMDNLACQTGAIRFGQLNPNWVYNKTEKLKPGWQDTLSFSHLLVDMSTDYQVYKSTHTVLFTVRGYSGLNLGTSWPFVEVVTSPKIVALQHKRYEARKGRFKSVDED